MFTSPKLRLLSSPILDEYFLAFVNEKKQYLNFQPIATYTHYN